MTTTTKIKYSLMSKASGELVGYTTSSNKGNEYCVDFTYTLQLHEDNTWLVDSPEHALWVLYNPTEWYNADLETPKHDLNPDEFIVVKLESIITITEQPVSIPTKKEIYGTFDKSAVDLLSSDTSPYEYNLYALKEYLRIKNKE